VQAEGMIELGGPDAKFGILSQDDDTSKGNVPSVVAALEAEGHEVVDIRFPPDTTDFTSFLTRMKSEGVDVIFYFYPQARAAEVIALGVQLDAAPGGYATRNVDPAVAVSGAVGGPLPVPFFSAQGTPSFAYPPNEQVQEFADNLKAFDPNMPLTGANSAFYTYDFVYMLTKAMQDAGTVDDPAAVAEALRALTYEGVAGKVCWADDQQNAVYDTGLVFVRDGEVDSTIRESDCA
jgi:ABC-type branched-subunit amino acid transport system substrate-binding protein